MWKEVKLTQTKTKVAPTNDINDGNTFEIPELPRNRAPLQVDEQVKELVQDALKNQICITAEGLFKVSESAKKEMLKILKEKRLEKKSVAFGEEMQIEDCTSEQK